MVKFNEDLGIIIMTYIFNITPFNNNAKNFKVN